MRTEHKKLLNIMIEDMLMSLIWPMAIFGPLCRAFRLYQGSNIELLGHLRTLPIYVQQWNLDSIHERNFDSHNLDTELKTIKFFLIKRLMLTFPWPRDLMRDYSFQSPFSLIGINAKCSGSFFHNWWAIQPMLSQKQERTNSLHR